MRGGAYFFYCWQSFAISLGAGGGQDCHHAGVTVEGDAGGGFRGSLAGGEVHLQGEIVAGRVAEHADLGTLGICNLLHFGAGPRLGTVAAVHEHRVVLNWKGFVNVG